jgi:hypothetical protein
MPVKYFAPKVTVKLCIIDFPRYVTFRSRWSCDIQFHENMLFISTGIFNDKHRPQILSVGTTANSPLTGSTPTYFGALPKPGTRLVSVEPQTLDVDMSGTT